MPYCIEYTDSANDDMSRLDRVVAHQVRNKLDELAGRAETVRHRALTGPLRGQYRLRVGNYRVLYELDRTNRRITVRAVGHRSEIYY
ncbi:MAG: type II toxin-antitoxin system RelE/ParE family toxin [Dehalococcoidia bacterium]|nr:type II toxin-antitoxin system RelE/ParE family toxin [Dehalococcoidia bacterium]